MSGEVLMETWIDVGAHLGEKTLPAAKADPGLRVYAFEPNLAVARKVWALSPWNFVVMPLAVTEFNGTVQLTLNADDACSSILPMDPKGVEAWLERERAGGIERGGEGLKETGAVQVPSMRLDTFMDAFAIDDVSWLKIDAQGHDLAVVRSAGRRLRWIERITLEVQITPIPLYQGASKKGEVLEYMEDHGFAFLAGETQSLGMEENLTFMRKPR